MIQKPVSQYSSPIEWKVKILQLQLCLINTFTKQVIQSAQNVHYVGYPWNTNIIHTLVEISTDGIQVFFNKHRHHAKVLKSQDCTMICKSHIIDAKHHLHDDTYSPKRLGKVKIETRNAALILTVPHHGKRFLTRRLQTK